MELVNINVGIFILVEIQAELESRRKAGTNTANLASVDGFPLTRKEILNEIFF